MQRGTLILVGILALQLGLAGVLALSGSDYAAYDAKDPLIAFDQGKIDQIAIDQTGGNSVTLKKQDGKWVIPSSAEFPADATKVTQFLDKLHDLKKGFPVATTSEAAGRFKVSDATNERRIVLSSNGKEAGKLWVGTSPSYRLSNVRSDGGDNIYSVGLSTYEIGARPEDWVDHEVLTIPADKVASIAFPDVTLERKDGKFVMEGAKDGEKVLDGKVEGAARAALHPSFDAIQGKGKDEIAKLDPPDFTVAVKQTDGTTRTYKYKKEAAGGAYLFAASDRDYVFRVAEASVQELADAKREKLIEAAKKAETPSPDKAGAQAETPSPSSGRCPGRDALSRPVPRPRRPLQRRPERRPRHRPRARPVRRPKHRPRAKRVRSRRHRHQARLAGRPKGPRRTTLAPRPRRRLRTRPIRMPMSRQVSRLATVAKAALLRRQGF